ncbi:BadF/BadG/BcrA/BcrD ATPase family protein [Cohnella mopanensis]|uniref:BadF/BadG/BcrA/BcrD ATPase family protein n=1 Tax=Cohnella mopanensis TaxID=2911966 RepID=UPI001EF82839|nr:BadF/BadG/BcrA/BcrD ATPase family protein [Cohnella mopanensis]
MMLTQDVVIGIDGGGTHSRAMVADLSGRVLAYVEKGPASLYKDSSAARNVHDAITEALEKAGRGKQHVRGIAAGIAGYDSPADLIWVESLTEVPGITCPKWHVNDAIVAHYGALMAKPGIVVISGTGSNIVAVTESGQQLSNYAFHHYAASAARFIAYNTVHEILAGNTDASDEGLIQAMLEHWNVLSLPEFYKLAQQGFDDDRQQRDKTFGQFAPMVTHAANQRSSVAVNVCDRAIHQIKVGIELLSRAFAGNTVEVAFIGSVINSPYFSNRLSELLLAGNHKRFTVAKPILSPVAGAVLLAMSKLEQPIKEEMIRHLREFA